MSHMYIDSSSFMNVISMNISSIVESNEEKSYDFTIWPTDKDITVSGFIKAIKIGN